MVRLLSILICQSALGICPCEKAKAHHKPQKNAGHAQNALSFAEEGNLDLVEPALQADSIAEALTPETVVKVNEAMISRAKSTLGQGAPHGKSDQSQIEQARSLRKGVASEITADEGKLAALQHKKSQIEDKIATAALEIAKEPPSETMEN